MIHGFVDVGGWATSLQNMKVNRILSSETGDNKPNNVWNQLRIWFIYSPNIKRIPGLVLDLLILGSIF